MPKPEGNHDRRKTILREVVPDDLRKTLHQLILLAKETDSRSRVMFSKIHNLQVEVAGLRASIKGLALAMVQTLEIVEASETETQAVLREFVREVLK